MVVLDVIGALVLGGVLGMGVYWIFTNVTFRKEPERYRYEMVRDVDGKWVEKVIDLSDTQKDS